MGKQKGRPLGSKGTAVKAAVAPATGKSYVTSNAVAFRANPEWIAWMDRLRRHCGADTIPNLVGEGLVALGRIHGFAEMPPERTTRKGKPKKGRQA